MDSPHTDSAGPLEGIVVIDLTRVLSGPYATMLLGDLGATVIKIEHPIGGDTTRHSAPFKNGQSHYFLSINRNKKSVGLDISKPRGQEILRSLCERADVLIENFRPDAMKRFGLDYESLSLLAPNLIYCSISGFGQSGPLRNRLAYDVITQAMSGVLSTNGEPNGAPVRLSIPIGDLNGGLLAVIGILASLAGRNKAQKARFVDISLHDGLISALGYMATHYDISGSEPQRTGSRHSSIVPYGTYRTRDGWVALAIFTTPFWKNFCTAINRDDLATDPRFSNTVGRMKNRLQLEPIVETIIAQRSTDEWEKLLSEFGVPASPILSIPEALEHEHTSARGMFRSISHRSYGSVRIPGQPLRLGGERADSPLPPPLLGEHTREVLREMLQIGEEELSQLEEHGVIGCSPATQDERGNPS